MTRVGENGAPALARGKFASLAVAVAGVLLSGCSATDDPGPQGCSSGNRVLIADHYSPGGVAAAEISDDADREMIHGIGDSIWCADTTDIDLIDTGRTLVRDFPTVCTAPAREPSPDIARYIDAGTNGGPVGAMGGLRGEINTISRPLVIALFVASARNSYCPG